MYYCLKKKRYIELKFLKQLYFREKNELSGLDGGSIDERFRFELFDLHLKKSEKTIIFPGNGRKIKEKKRKKKFSSENHEK